MTTSKSRSALPKDAAKDKTFAIVVSRYHEELTQELLRGAQSTLESLGAKKSDVHAVWVPGTFEIPLAARALVSQDFDAVICLGIVIKGETMHDEYIAREAARAISALAQASGVPVTFGILTVQTLEQAKARSGGDKGHKGTEAAETAVEMIQILEQIKTSGKKLEKSVGFASGL